jgi:hypothetical protein
MMGMTMKTGRSLGTQRGIWPAMVAAFFLGIIVAVLQT